MAPSLSDPAPEGAPEAAAAGDGRRRSRGDVRFRGMAVLLVAGAVLYSVMAVRDGGVKEGVVAVCWLVAAILLWRVPPLGLYQQSREASGWDALRPLAMIPVALTLVLLPVLVPGP